MTCATGGGIVRRHNRISRYLQEWLNAGRADAEALLEQRVLIPDGVMDITVGHGSQQVWVDVAVVSATSDCPRFISSRAKKDGVAARAEEAAKRRRYGARVRPFVLESGGRPGASARALLAEFALDDPTSSTDVALAWKGISNILQSETAASILKSWGGWHEVGRACEIYMP